MPNGGGYRRGLDYLKNQQDLSGSGSYAKRMTKLWLKNGDTARLWFVTDYGDIGVPLCHMVKRKRRDGSFFNADVLCGRVSLTEDHAVCSICVKQGLQWAQGMDTVPEAEKISGPWPRAVALVWVDFIVHAIRDPKNGDGWTRVNVSGSDTSFWKETVCDYRLLIMREKITEQLRDYLAGDPSDESIQAPTTLLDIGWKLKTTGERTAKQEVLTPDAKAPRPETIVAIRTDGPDLDEIIEAEFGKSPRIAPTGDGHTDPATGAATETIDYDPDDVPAGGSDEDDLGFD